jgi:iron-sulfur cluster assembly 2
MPNISRVFVKDGSKVVVDSASFELVKGATLDYKEELIKSAFVVSNNPQSESACGCGSSFAAKNFAANPAID